MLAVWLCYLFVGICQSHLRISYNHLDSNIIPDDIKSFLICLDKCQSDERCVSVIFRLNGTQCTLKIKDNIIMNNISVDGKCSESFKNESISVNSHKTTTILYSSSSDPNSPVLMNSTSTPSTSFVSNNPMVVTTTESHSSSTPDHFITIVTSSISSESTFDSGSSPGYAISSITDSTSAESTDKELSTGNFNTIYSTDNAPGLSKPEATDLISSTSERTSTEDKTTNSFNSRKTTITESGDAFLLDTESSQYASSKVPNSLVSKSSTSAPSTSYVPSPVVVTTTESHSSNSESKIKLESTPVLSESTPSSDLFTSTSETTPYNNIETSSIIAAPTNSDHFTTTEASSSSSKSTTNTGSGPTDIISSKTDSSNSEVLAHKELNNDNLDTTLSTDHAPSLTVPATTDSISRTSESTPTIGKTTSTTSNTTNATLSDSISTVISSATNDDTSNFNKVRSSSAISNENSATNSDLRSETELDSITNGMNIYSESTDNDSRSTNYLHTTSYDDSEPKIADELTIESSAAINSETEPTTTEPSTALHTTANGRDYGKKLNVTSPRIYNWTEGLGVLDPNVTCIDSNKTCYCENGSISVFSDGKYMDGIGILYTGEIFVIFGDSEESKINMTSTIARTDCISDSEFNSRTCSMPVVVNGFLKHHSIGCNVNHTIVGTVPEMAKCYNSSVLNCRKRGWHCAKSTTFNDVTLYQVYCSEPMIKTETTAYDRTTLIKTTDMMETSELGGVISTSARKTTTIDWKSKLENLTQGLQCIDAQKIFTCVSSNNLRVITADEMLMGHSLHYDGDFVIKSAEELATWSINKTIKSIECVISHLHPNTPIIINGRQELDKIVCNENMKINYTEPPMTHCHGLSQLNCYAHKGCSCHQRVSKVLNEVHCL